jgi:SPP1 family predicted phage head-tail adaptor
MRAGKLDRRITIERKTVTLSDRGQETLTWSTLATVWAEKRENTGSERFAREQIVGATLVTFRIRWSDAVSAVTVEDRVGFDGRTFEIMAVREIGRREGVELDCTAHGDEPVAAT